MGNEPGSSQKKWDTGSEMYLSVSRQQENMNKLWRKQQFWVSCMDTVAPQNCQKSSTVCHCWEPQVTLPELTRPEQTAFPPPGMLVSQLLRIRIRWWGFWLTSVFIRSYFALTSVPFMGKHLRYKLLCLFSLFKEYFIHIYQKYN